MRFDIVTIFPQFFTGPLDYGIVRRAREAGLIEIGIQDLREFTHDKHRTVDDRPFGGGEGMVLKPEPLFEAVESILDKDAGFPAGPGQTVADVPASTAVILLSASGKLFQQADARRLSALNRVVLICGRYEGVDERVAEHLATEELCVGNFVLSGGELAAAVIVDSVTRLLPGALGNEASAIYESFSAIEAGEIISGQAIEAVRAANAAERAQRMLLDYPHYTRPAEFRGWAVPEVLIGGNHEEIRRWRRRASLEKTRRNRPDLLA
jgi:tRNA (guanine37-N1)-methyltransferase